MTRGRLRSPYTPDPETEGRLAVWRRLAEKGVPVVDIAAQLGISRTALDRYVCRARERGDPDAVRHANAGPETGQGVVKALAPHRSHQRQRRTLRQVERRDVA